MHVFSRRLRPSRLFHFASLPGFPALLFFLASSAGAATVARPDSGAAPATADSGAIPATPSSAWIYWGVPAAEVLGVNALFAGYNIWITQARWARVDWNSVGHNFRSGWEWDYDRFSINQIGHPYQGSLYYSAARSRGHDYLASTAYTAFGSLQWEYFMERDAPSYNDFVTTTVGGSMLGEISFRLANAVLDEKTWGLERVAREAGGAVVNPVYAFNRLLDGRVYAKPRRLRETPRERKDGPGFVRLASGADLPFFSSAEGEDPNPRQHVPKANTELLAVYGDEFEAKNPYDYFIVNAGLSLIQDPVAVFNARVQLYKTGIFETRHGEGQLLVGQVFDYMNNGIYKLGMNGLGGGYAHRYRWGDGWFHGLHTQIGGILVGGVSTEFFRRQARDYNLGPGMYSTTRITLGKDGFGHLAFVSDRYWVHTRSGAKGDELIGYGQLEVGKTVWRDVGVLLNFASYDRSARYPAFGSRAELTQEAKLKLTYTFL